MIDIDDIIAVVLLVGTYYFKDESLCHVFSIRFTVDEFGGSSISSFAFLVSVPLLLMLTTLKSIK